MGEMVQFKLPDGKTCLAYLATPKTESGARLCLHPGVVGAQRSNQEDRRPPRRGRLPGPRTEVYAASAKLAWDRTLKFLKIALT